MLSDFPPCQHLTSPNFEKPRKHRPKWLKLCKGTFFCTLFHVVYLDLSNSEIFFRRKWNFFFSILTLELFFGFCPKFCPKHGPITPKLNRGTFWSMLYRLHEKKNGVKIFGFFEKKVPLFGVEKYFFDRVNFVRQFWNSKLKGFLGCSIV